MKKTILIGLFVSLLLLDWAALDDITTGKEPSFLLEYSILAISLPILGVIGYHLVKS